MDKFTKESLDNYITGHYGEDWVANHHEDDFEENLEDIEEDEQDAYTRCEKCGCRMMLKNLKKHKEEKHGKRKGN